MDIIEPAQMEWASPFFVPQKHGTLHFFVDYHKLDATTIRDSYPIPRMDECINSFGDATIFSTLDVNSRYLKLNCQRRSGWNHRYIPSWSFPFHSHDFWIEERARVFQRTVYVLLTKFKCQFSLVYLDDIFISSGTPDENIYHVREVVAILFALASLSLKNVNSLRISSILPVMSFAMSHLKESTRTIDAMPRFEYTTTVTELRSFLRLCNAFCRFVPNLAHMATPLNKKLLKVQPQTFHRLSSGEITTLDTLSPTSWEPVFLLPRSQGA